MTTFKNYLLSLGDEFRFLVYFIDNYLVYKREYLLPCVGIKKMCRVL